MIRGIAIFGLNGGGKSTLTHALAKQIDYFEMDVEDYYFPEQRKSRKWALENDSVIDTEYIGELPFSNPSKRRKKIWSACSCWWGHVCTANGVSKSSRKS